MKNKEQIEVCKQIIESLNKKDYHNASILVRFYLNDSSFIWYKSINNIIEDQITNICYDATYGTELTKNFFERQILKLKQDLNRFNIGDK